MPVGHWYTEVPVHSLAYFSIGLTDFKKEKVKWGRKKNLKVYNKPLFAVYGKIFFLPRPLKLAYFFSLHTKYFPLYGVQCVHFFQCHLKDTIS